MQTRKVTKMVRNLLQDTLHLWGGNLVTWRSKNLKVVALFNAEAKFRGIAKGNTGSCVLWLQQLLPNLAFIQKVVVNI